MAAIAANVYDRVCSKQWPPPPPPPRYLCLPTPVLHSFILRDLIYAFGEKKYYLDESALDFLLSFPHAVAAEERRNAAATCVWIYYSFLDSSEESFGDAFIRLIQPRVFKYYDIFHAYDAHAQTSAQTL